MNKKYFYLAMSQQDLLENQVIEELVRERNDYYINRGNPVNFWILMSPFLLLTNEIYNKIKKTKFYSLKNSQLLHNDKFYIGVILSTNIEYINWLKLRLGYFENVDNPLLNDRFKSDGICGEIEIEEQSINSLFETSKKNIHPKIMVDIYSNIYDIYSNLI
jgi:hypothetical protein